jgi:hypothetical protein
MVDAIATILTGVGASVMTEGRDDDEWRKRLTAKLRQMPTLVLIDNLRHTLDSGALAAVLTAPFWEDRILGISEMARLPIRCLWIATGNNPECSNEMARRLVRIRMDAGVDQPWRGRTFRHPDLMGWVRANRGRLVAACLTLCRAWIAAGRPRGVRSIGGFEAWAQVMGGVLDVAGVAGFLGNLDEMLAAADAEGAMWHGFVAAWWGRFGSAEVGIVDLYAVAIQVEPPLELGSGNDRSQRTRLGIALGRIRDRIFRLDRQAVRIEARGTYQRAQRWRLAPRQAAGGDGQAMGSSDLVNVVNLGEPGAPEVHDAIRLENNGAHEAREPREPFSNCHARAGVCAPAIGQVGTRSPGSPGSPGLGALPSSGGARGGEHHGDGCPPIPDPPAWLDGVP